ncbi:MAG: glycosyltransferase family 39 protein [Patescibacteria group bacterium]|nr:glycosyltransferase family 39 protein [Patescibacteria group bacterium]
MVAIIQRNKTLIFLFIILAIAAFFRLWQLSSIPPGLYPDVAINGNEALESLKTGNFKIFYPENNGREGLMIWLIALSFSIFGVSIWSIKIVAAIIGILTVGGLFLLTKELFIKETDDKQQATSIALLSSFFLAVSFWHINFSRIGFRAILLPFVLVVSFYFLFKGFQVKKLSNFIIAGLFFGLGFYTYISYRFIVILLPLILIFWWFIYQKQNLQKQFLKFVICNLTFIILIALPIGIYFLQNPGEFISRATGVSIFTQQNPLKTFGESLVKHLGMFNFYGDPNWRHNFAGSPMLLWPLGILFLIGFFLTIKRLLKKPLAISYWLLILWFFIMLLPGILTYEGIPHALRIIGVIPVVYIFAGLGGWNIYQWINQNTKHKTLLYVTVFLFFLMTGVVEFDKYFNKWGQNPEVKNAFSEDYVKIGNYLNSLSAEIQKYVIVNRPGVPVSWFDGIPMPAQTVMFIENTKYEKPQSIYLLPENLDRIKIDYDPSTTLSAEGQASKNTVIVPIGEDKELFKKVSERFPQGKLKKITEIFVYEIK